MKTTCIIFGVILALMTGPIWGGGNQEVPEFNFEAEVNAIEGHGARDDTRRYINIQVVDGKESLLAALRDEGFDSLPRKSFHGREFFVIDQKVPEGLIQYLDDTPIVNKSTPKEMPTAASFWCIYMAEGLFDGEQEGRKVITNGAYFAVKYYEVPQDDEENEAE